MDKDILAGKPIIKGTRIPVYLVLEILSAGLTEDDVLKEYPTLTKEDIQACLAYASKIVREEEIIPIGTN